MNEGSSKSIVIKIGFAILVIALIDLFYLNYLILNKSNEDQQLREIDQENLEVEASPEATVLPSPAPPPTEKIIETQTVVEKEVQTVISNAQKEIFIPLGSGSLASKDWAAIPGLEVEINTSKYSGIESIRFEATIWPEGGNGTAFARLYNVTDNNPFVESEISSSSAAGEYKNSSSIPFPNISKTYGVQAKSAIENFPTKVENARVKITLK